MDLFKMTSAVLDGQSEAYDDGYVALRVDAASCDPLLAEDFQGVLAGRWMAKVMRSDFEQACYGARIYGPCGTFDGVVADNMPNYWRRTEQTAGGRPVWVPDGRHPIGKWLADVASRLMPLPSLDEIDGILRRHGIEGSKEPMPTMKECDGGWALLVHKPKAKVFKLPGISRDDGLWSLWRTSRN